MKKRSIVIMLVLGLIAASMAAPAAAKKKATTFYLHGRGPVAEAYINEMWLDSAWMSMDQEEPTATEPSSMNVTNYYGGPNTDCNGNGLLPVWKGDFSKKFKGDVTVTLNTIATPAAQMTVSLYADATGTCTGDVAGQVTEAPPPNATETIEVAPGPAVTKVTFKKVKFKAFANVILQLSVPTGGAGQIRVLFDSTEYPSNVSFR